MKQLHEYETPLTNNADKACALDIELLAFARDLERKLAMCREHIEAIEAASRVAFMVTTCPIMTDTLAGIGRRCQETLAATEPKQ
jgi:hypothetical protein